MKSPKLLNFILILFTLSLIFSCADEDGQGGVLDAVPTIKFELNGNATVDISNAYFDNDGFGSPGSITIPWSTSYDGEDGDEWSWEVKETEEDVNALIVANQYLDGDLMTSDTAYGPNCHIHLQGYLSNFIVYTPSVIKLELKGSTTVDISNAYFDNNGFGSNGSILIPWSSSFYGEIGDEWSWEIEEKDGDPDALIIANQYQNGILISTDTAYGAGSSLNLNGTVQ